jgi:putative salt-induced outer membrane protein
MKEKKNRFGLHNIKTQITTIALVCGALSAFAQAPTPEKKPGWDTSAALGFTLTRGNSDTLLFTGNIVTGKKWDQNELSFGADATYGENDGNKNAESLHGFGQYNWLFTDRAYGYARLEGLHDAVADVEYRITLSPGAGYYFIKTDASKLSGEVGPGFIYEKQGGNTRGYLTLRLAERYDQKIGERAKLWQSVELLPQVDNFDNFIVNAEIGLETALTKKLSLRTYLQDTYDNQPASGRKKNDLKLVTALAYKF